MLFSVGINQLLLKLDIKQNFNEWAGIRRFDWVIMSSQKMGIFNGFIGSFGLSTKSLVQS